MVYALAQRLLIVFTQILSVTQKFCMRNAKYLSDNSEHENISNHKRNTCMHRKATKLTNLRRYIGRRDADGPLLSDTNRCAVPVHTEATTTYRTSGWLAAPREPD